MPFSSKSFPEKALIAIGTSLTDSSILLAVVMTSSIESIDSSDESCACKLKIDNVIAIKNSLFMFNLVNIVISPFKELQFNLSCKKILLGDKISHI